MSQLRAVQPVAAPGRGYEPRGARDLFYKADHPRSIDHYIDFFGDGAPGVEPTADLCGEALLASLA